MRRSGEPMRFLRSISQLLLVLLLVFPFVSRSAGESTEASNATQLFTEGTVDENLYIVGPGDVLGVGVWGELGRYETIVVNPDGNVIIPPVGPIKIDGLPFSDARNEIIDQLSKYYKRDIITVSLCGIRVFRLHVVGMVEAPGVVSANATTRVSQALALAGGVSPGGSTRNILLERQGTRQRVDVTRYLLLGDNSMNPFVTGGDVIFVPPKVGDVSVFGEVSRPGSYEFVEGEALGELIDLAGGFKPSAWLDTIEVYRFSKTDPTESFRILLPGYSSAIDTFRLELGDRIFVRMIPKWHEDARVEIIGEVIYPGVYVIEEGIDTLSELIKRAGGFTKDASLAEARIIRGEYAARSLAVENEAAVIRGFQGEPSEKEKDLVKTLAKETKGRVSIEFDKLFVDGRMELDIKLRRGDVIEIPRASNYVRVSGCVRNPGLLSFQSGLSYMDYIRLAGGFAPGADRRGTRLIRASGGQQVKPKSEKICPGDMIWVPTKAEKSRWDIAKDMIVMLGQVATIYLLLDTVTSGSTSK